MSQVFLFYARPDWEAAQRVAATLRERGYQVWLDDELPAHRAYDEVIQERLRSASAVVVLWSTAAVKSQWVRAEADSARQSGKLVQGRLEEMLPPIPFNLIQCVDLTDWNGDTDAEGWRKLEASVRELVGLSSDQESPSMRSSRPRGASICVLPFENMSGEPEQEYFSDGISEDITTDLSKVSALAVTARNSAFAFKGKAVDICEVAGKLAVGHVLEGSVRKAGNRVRITAQLINGATGDHVWAERYDRELTDIFAIQDEISKAIVSALKLKLLPEEKAAIEERGTSSAEAYNLYLMARKYWISGNYGDVRRDQRVVRICDRAVEIDPGYARAWALMSLAQGILRFGFELPGDGGLAAAERALSLDPSIAEAHSAKARVAWEQGDNAEADREIAEAVKLDPRSWEVNKEAGRLFLSRGMIDEAMAYLEKAVAIIDTDYHAWALLLTCYQAKGLGPKAILAGEMMIKGAEKALTDDPSNGTAIGIGAGGLAVTGQRERAKEWIERAMLLDPDNLNMKYNFACVLAAHLQDPDGAIELLGRTLPFVGRLPLKNAMSDPDFDSVRDDPRFQKLISDSKIRLGIEH